MEINWNTEKGNLDITFRYPSVRPVCVDEKKNIWKSSSYIIDDAIQKNLKGTKIRWTNGSSTSGLMTAVLELKIRFIDPHKDISMRKLNSILHNIDKDISEGIYNLINEKNNIMKERYEKVVAEYTEAFCKKHDLQFDYWVGGDVGTVGQFGDYFFNFDDVRFDLDSSQPKGRIFEWYDNVLLDEKNHTNYNSYCMAQKKK